MARRLARRPRCPPPESLSLEESSGSVSEEAAESRCESGPPYHTAHAIAQAFAEAAPRNSTLHRAAKALADQLAGAKGRIPEATISGILADWKKRFAPTTHYCLARALGKILRTVDQRTGSQLASAIPKLRRPQARLTTITPEEFAALLRHATPWMRLFLLLTGVMALRFTEAWSARDDNWNAEKQTLTLTTKGGYRREFPVPDEIAALLRIIPEGPGTFITRLKGGTISRVNLWKHWGRLKKKAGVREEVRTHDLRRTAAVRIYSLTKDIFAAKALLGHDSLTSTAIYLAPHEPAAMRALKDQLASWKQKGDTVQ